MPINFTFNLDKLKEIKWSEIKKQRDELEFGTFEYNGNIYDCDPISATRIMGAMLAGIPVEWKTNDNQVVPLTPEQVQGLYTAMITNTAAAHARARIARASLDNATTILEINAVEL